MVYVRLPGDGCSDSLAQQFHHLEFPRPAGLFDGDAIPGPDRVCRFDGVAVEPDVPSGDGFRRQ